MFFDSSLIWLMKWLSFGWPGYATGVIAGEAGIWMKAAALLLFCRVGEYR